VIISEYRSGGLTPFQSGLDCNYR